MILLRNVISCAIEEWSTYFKKNYGCVRCGDTSVVLALEG